MHGYREEPRVSPQSTTETYAAFKLSLDNWRWAGVPFYLRTGKRLRKKKSEVVIEFKQPPLALFRQASMAPPEANQLVISIQPEETIKLRLSVKVPGPDVTASPVDMRFNYADYFGVEHETGYETLALRRDDRRSQSLQARRHRRDRLGASSIRFCRAGREGRCPSGALRRGLARSGRSRRDARARRPQVEARCSQKGSTHVADDGFAKAR